MKTLKGVEFIYGAAITAQHMTVAQMEAAYRSLPDNLRAWVSTVDDHVGEGAMLIAGAGSHICQNDDVAAWMRAPSAAVECRLAMVYALLADIVSKAGADPEKIKVAQFVIAPNAPRLPFDDQYVAPESQS